jgi:hypothetical protein
VHNPAALRQRVQHALFVFRDIHWKTPFFKREDGVGDYRRLGWPARIPRANGKALTRSRVRSVSAGGNLLHIPLQNGKWLLMALHERRQSAGGKTKTTPENRDAREGEL